MYDSNCTLEAEARFVVCKNLKKSFSTDSSLGVVYHMTQVSLSLKTYDVFDLKEECQNPLYRN